MIVSFEPLPANKLGGTFEGSCEVSEATNLQLTLDCEDGVTLSLQQEVNPRVDFGMIPKSLTARASFVSSTFGSPANEVILRDSSGTLIFAYSDQDAPWELLDPPWRTSLEPLSFSAGPSDCEDELFFDCVTCTSRVLTVSDGEVEQALLQGEEGSFGPWTVVVARLMNCEATCMPASPQMFRIGVIHDSVRRTRRGG